MSYLIWLQGPHGSHFVQVFFSCLHTPPNREVKTQRYQIRYVYWAHLWLALIFTFRGSTSWKQRHRRAFFFSPLFVCLFVFPRILYKVSGNAGFGESFSSSIKVWQFILQTALATQLISACMSPLLHKLMWAFLMPVLSTPPLQTLPLQSLPFLYLYCHYNQSLPLKKEKQTNKQTTNQGMHLRNKKIKVSEKSACSVPFS